ncbi:MAG: ribonuclease HI [Lachnospiraceae bacterium]|nr:ribonuclease HI [Lachnospiraceae bacterium]
METLVNVEIYTDGACSGNPGPGGYGIILRYKDRSGKVHEREYSEGFSETTNNRMEVLAAIAALQKLTKPCFVRLYSDSQYLVKAFNERWINTWIKEDFRRNKSSAVKNIDLWEALLEAMKGHAVEFIWVKGHENNEFNNRCDRLAVASYDGMNKE